MWLQMIRLKKLFIHLKRIEQGLEHWLLLYFLFKRKLKCFDGFIGLKKDVTTKQLSTKMVSFKNFTVFLFLSV